MGLDAVEILMEIEEEFGITIAEEEIPHFRTMGSMHDYLLEKCGVRKRSDCPTRSAFYRLRRAVAEVCDVEPRTFWPDTEVLPLLGRWQRKRTWRRVEKELGLTLPELENRTGASAFWGAAVAGGIGFVTATALSRDLCVGIGSALVALNPGLLIGYAIGLCWIPTVWRPCRTLGGLARSVVAINYCEFHPAVEPNVDSEGDPTWERLCKVIVEQLGVPRDSLRRETDFVKDLGF
ncbi:MAG: hypothetical protein H8E44_20245 [Planctomycetes bacterium]|nr:hypothetical protein [Planctomycetota bacterium]